MGLFDHLFGKKSADGLPEGLSALHKATDEEKNKGNREYAFRCLQKIYQLGVEAVAKHDTRFDGEKFIPRIDTLANAYKSGKMGWHDESGEYQYADICEPDLNKAYACYLLGAEVASMCTNDFKKDYVLNCATKKLVIGMYERAGTGMINGYIHSPDPKVSDQRYAASMFVMAIMLGRARYGMDADGIHWVDSNVSHPIKAALEALIPLQHMLGDYPLSWYADEIISAHILSEDDDPIPQIRQLSGNSQNGNKGEMRQPENVASNVADTAERAQEKEDAERAQKKKDMDAPLSVQDMPSVITGPYGYKYHRLNMSAFSAEYQSEHDSSIATIHDSDVKPGSANTSDGYFYW